MKEKELRIALVCFGGVSLAVYMHGITKEVLKLVRASGVLHAIRDRDERARASFFDKVNASDPEYDTDAIYFELLRDIGCRTVELRVIVDIVAGASAGGINGTMLARALSHDLPMGALRDLWLEHADVTDLLAPEARARVTSKVLLTPVVWFLGATGLWKAVKDPEVRRKVSLFVRSRWFKPPLSGCAHGRVHVQCGHRHGPAEAFAGIVDAVRPAARSVRHRHRPLWLSAAGADPRSANHPRARASAHVAVPLSAAGERRSHQRF